MDFREVDWSGAEAGALIAGARALGLRLGQIRPGWSRMVVDLAGPHVLERPGCGSTGKAARRAAGAAGRGERTGFAASAGTPDLPGWDLPAARSNRAPQRGGGRCRVVLDPGHGGIDPGAEVAG